MNGLREKIKESFTAVLPVIVIVLVLCFTIAPVSNDLLLSFLIGSLLVITGLSPSDTLVI